MTTGAPGASKRGRGEQLSVRGECEGERSGVRMRGGDIVPAEPGVSAADAASRGPSRDTLHSDAAAAAR